MLTLNNLTIIKFFLHISKDEQRRRLQSRLDNPDKRWKFSAADYGLRPTATAWQGSCKAP